MAKSIVRPNSRSVSATPQSATPTLEPEIIKAKKRALPPTLRHEIYHWGHVYDGPRDDLIRARICEPKWFVDGTEKDKKGRTVRQRIVTHEGRKVKTQQLQNGKFRVAMYFTADEHAANAANPNRNDALEKAVAVEQCAIESLRTSADAFHDDVLHVLELAYRMFRTSCDRSGGYGFEPHVAEAIGNALSDAYWTAKRAAVTFSPRVRIGQVRAIRLNTARQNAPLQSLLKSVIRGADTGKVIAGAREVA